MKFLNVKCIIKKIVCVNVTVSVTEIYTGIDFLYSF